MILLPEETADDFIRNHLHKGDVLIWENYQFENGSKKTSRFIILTDCQSDEFLTIRATANVEIYQNKSVKIYREFIELLPNQEPSFEKHTIIDLQRIHKLNLKIMKKISGTSLQRPTQLTNETIDKIDKLVKESKILRRDWIKWILNSKRSEFLTSK